MGDWQPIETAPKDRTLVLIWAHSRVITAAWNEDYNGFWDVGDYFRAIPTHWMPLPKPPTE